MSSPSDTFQAQIDAFRTAGKWEEVLKHVRQYERWLADGHSTDAATAYVATVHAEVALRRKRTPDADEARKLLWRALGVAPGFPDALALLPEVHSDAWQADGATAPTGTSAGVSWRRRSVPPTPAAPAATGALSAGSLSTSVSFRVGGSAAGAGGGGSGDGGAGADATAAYTTLQQLGLTPPDDMAAMTTHRLFLRLRALQWLADLHDANGDAEKWWDVCQAVVALVRAYAVAKYGDASDGDRDASLAAVEPSAPSSGSGEGGVGGDGGNAGGVGVANATAVLQLSGTSLLAVDQRARNTAAAVCCHAPDVLFHLGRVEASHLTSMHCLSWETFDHTMFTKAMKAHLLDGLAMVLVHGLQSATAPAWAAPLVAPTAPSPSTATGDLAGVVLAVDAAYVRRLKASDAACDDFAAPLVQRARRGARALERVLTDRPRWREGWALLVLAYAVARLPRLALQAVDSAMRLRSGKPSAADAAAGAPAEDDGTASTAPAPPAAAAAPATHSAGDDATVHWVHGGSVVPEAVLLLVASACCRRHLSELGPAVRYAELAVQAAAGGDASVCAACHEAVGVSLLACARREGVDSVRQRAQHQAVAALAAAAGAAVTTPSAGGPPVPLRPPPRASPAAGGAGATDRDSVRAGEGRGHEDGVPDVSPEAAAACASWSVAYHTAVALVVTRQAAAAAPWVAQALRLNADAAAVWLLAAVVAHRTRGTAAAATTVSAALERFPHRTQPVLLYAQFRVAGDAGTADMLEAASAAAVCVLQAAVAATVPTAPTTKGDGGGGGGGGGDDADEPLLRPASTRSGLLDALSPWFASEHVATSVLVACACVLETARSGNVAAATTLLSRVDALLDDLFAHHAGVDPSLRAATLFAAGGLHEVAGAVAAAEAQYAAAVAVDLDHLPSLVQLAVLAMKAADGHNAESSTDGAALLDRALAFATRALRVDSTSSAAWHTYGKVHAAQGRGGKAAQAFLTALECADAEPLVDTRMLLLL